ncbi:uncharacterized protein IUM83_16201 [Phytophthora cinnamomi]|uniref:uncharacterized protein n=1 Tax=Phytophthora cinnamomi TaxID=4785 RepID=UPI00355A240B|nr:hypothetical protein IUM83_16201 [Phytophthora cinnamomi]
MCVCNQCVTSNDMSPDFSMNPERCVCPVCGVNIHLILPHTGSEEEKYWNWVLSTKPTLPSGFLKSFKSAGKKLSEDSLAETGIQDTTAEVPTSTDSEDHPVQQSSPPKPFPLPLSHGIPQNVELTDRATPTSVFFPCQHMCVCNYCIATNDMSPECSLNLERCVCPVCSADIGIILPHTGTEEDTYWKWVLATKPRLPSQFTKDFKNARIIHLQRTGALAQFAWLTFASFSPIREFKEVGRRLNKNATPTRGRRSSIVTMFRREPTPQEEAPKEPPPKPKVPVLGRRHSWQPGEVANVQNVAASNEHEEAHNCSIL